jgi:hypothetical protein
VNSIICKILNHKYEYKKQYNLNSTAVCECGTAKAFHDHAILSYGKIKLTTECKKFVPRYMGQDVCVRCKHVGFVYENKKTDEAYVKKDG